MRDDSDADVPAEAAASGKSDFLIVGLGGSAGAISSFRDFFSNVPPDSGIAYVVILHLSPEHDSRLAEVLQNAASIPVSQVRDRVRVEPNRVYVIPPNHSLAMSDGLLVLSQIATFEERRAPIDIFFRTLAEQHESRAVCVIMSGSGSDGSMGLRRIKEHNGLVLAQEPSDAGFGEMPRNSIATGMVDFVVPAPEMPRRIIEYRDQLRSLRLPDPPDEEVSDDAEALVDILSQLRLHTGHDFSNYKRATVLRRIERRVIVQHLQSLHAYARFVRKHPEEAQALLRELLISVTNFFRDREVWESIATHLLPKLVQSRRNGDQLRVWVAGCATGEEAYSIAMLLAEQSRLPNVQIFATDLDQDAIARARYGCYNEVEVADVSPERLQRFFLREPDGYRIRREIREMVLFAHHNLIKDPPFSHIDFASCRNLLIYLNRTAQKRAMDVLHFAINPGGYLLLGTAETIDPGTHLFNVVDKDAHIYQSRGVARSIAPPPMIPLLPIESRALAPEQPYLPAQPAAQPERFAPIDLHQRLLEAYAAPSLVTDEQYEIVHMSQRAAAYLEFKGGEASVNLLHVVRPALRPGVRSALLHASETGTAAVVRGAVTGTGGGSEAIDVVVKPLLRESDPSRGLFLVLFEPGGESAEPAAAAAPVDPAAHQLEEELMRVRSQMRAALERHELQTEEAKATNEELQAMNEELRSTAEELETSQEELQSVNEELQTVNQELKVKIDEISHAADDMSNLMSSTEIGTIFVDRSLHVKLFTPRAADLFNLIGADIGRSLLDIRSRLADDDLTADLGRVLDRLQTIEREVQTREGTWYLMRMLPYRTFEDRIGGVVLTFIDITERRRAEAAVRESEEQLRRAIEIQTVGVIFFADDGRITYANEAFLRMSGYTREDIEKRRMRREDLALPEERVDGRTGSERYAEHERAAPHEREYLRKDGSRCWALFSSTRINADQTAEFIIDITDRRKADEALRSSELQGERERLLRRIVESQEEERQRIARELHDEMGQHIAALKLGFEAMQPENRIERMKVIVHEIDRSIDRLTLALRPPPLEDLGLEGAIATLVEQFTVASGLRVDLHTTGLETPLPDTVERTTYRVLQEALTNVSRHAEASTVSVIVERERDSLRMIIEDDGRGFDAEAHSDGARPARYGIIGIRERLALVGGTLNIESAVGDGTAIYVRIPLPAGDPG